MKKSVIISLGGSVIVPDKVNVEFLKNFKQLILTRVKKGKRFFIITGGGKTARTYQAVAGQISGLTRDDLDWLGIHSTVLNAHLIRTIFRQVAHKQIINDQEDMKESFSESVIVASGWAPGWSTDYIATRIAEKYRIEKLINITNIDYVYDKDPNQFKNAKPLKTISWKEFRKLVGNKWDPGLNAPFDPIASKLAQKIGLEVNILNGNDIQNLGRCLSNESFKGTVIN